MFPNMLLEGDLDRESGSRRASGLMPNRRKSRMRSAKHSPLLAAPSFTCAGDGPELAIALSPPSRPACPTACWSPSGGPSSVPGTEPMKMTKTAELLTTYAELDQYVEAFACGHFSSVILIGRRGLQKDGWASPWRKARPCF